MTVHLTRRTHTRTFFSCTCHISLMAHSAWLKMLKGENSPCHRSALTSPSRTLMSLLNIPHCLFPRVLSSPTSPQSRPSTSSTSMVRSCRNSPSASARWSGSGRLSNPAPNTPTRSQKRKPHRPHSHPRKGQSQQTQQKGEAGTHKEQSTEITTCSTSELEQKASQSYPNDP